jgi:tetratricopeptide (TPR) repeat protein
MFMSLIEKALRQLEKDRHAVSLDTCFAARQPAAAEEPYEKADDTAAALYAEAPDEPHTLKRRLMAGLAVVLVLAAAAWYMKPGAVSNTEQRAAMPQLKEVPSAADRINGSARVAPEPQPQQAPDPMAVKMPTLQQAAHSEAAPQTAMPAAPRPVPVDAAGTKKHPLSPAAEKPLQQQAAVMKEAALTVQPPPKQGISQALIKKAEAPPEVARTDTANLLQQEPESADSLNDNGVMLLEKGNAVRAQEYFTKALRLMPDHEKALNNMGLSLYARGRTAEALDYYRRAVKVNPRNIETWVNMGIALRSRRDFPAAAAVFQKALALDPVHPETLYNYGLLLKDMGQQEKSRACFEQFLKTAPPHLQGVADSVKTYLQASSGQQQ